MLTICTVCIIKLTTTHVCELCFGVAIFSPLYYPRMWVINFMLIHVDTNLLPTYFQLDTSLDTPLYVDMWICWLWWFYWWSIKCEYRFIYRHEST
uniref:Orf94 n=1 Tax=Picobiliphyte sp. MS584-11 TaxID=1157699 RepID=A0A2H4R8A4_9EUKA|nr:orf94 [Picobiliphyte sp. MS584-11]